MKVCRREACWSGPLSRARPQSQHSCYSSCRVGLWPPRTLSLLLSILVVMRRLASEWDCGSESTSICTCGRAWWQNRVLACVLPLMGCTLSLSLQTGWGHRPWAHVLLLPAPGESWPFMHPLLLLTSTVCRAFLPDKGSSALPLTPEVLPAPDRLFSAYFLSVGWELHPSSQPAYAGLSLSLKSQV